jgi:hypothetical protein
VLYTQEGRTSAGNRFPFLVVCHQWAIFGEISLTRLSFVGQPDLNHFKGCGRHGRQPNVDFLFG